ncbi:MAG: formate dehydrogenase subunit delta [Rhodospirillales bacterium]|nr:formate dehydrogenase subunit delta [Rhodospirillales bacterium]
MQPDKLVMMANQIAKFFEPQGEARALPQITSHIELFWDPRMRKAITAHVAQGGAGLDPLAKQAIGRLKSTVGTP